jgi:hypothetical protein
MPITNGTNIDDILSANHWIGAFDHWASWIRFTIWASAVSFQTLVTWNSKLHIVLIVHPNTFDQTVFSTGILSHVSIDSSILECHDTIIQSIGILSHGLTNTISHLTTWSIATSTKVFHFFIFAILGANHISLAIACEVDHLASASNNFHRATNIINKPATSK